MSGRVFEVKSAQSSQTPELTIYPKNETKQTYRRKRRCEDGHRNGV